MKNLSTTTTRPSLALRLSGLAGFFLLLLLLFPVAGLDAQVESLGVAIPTEVVFEDPEVGDILCQKEGGIILCDEIYDPSMFGVVTQTPAIAFRHDDDESLPLVVSSGNTLVKVTSAAGNIEVGDLITSSEIPGVGQKAVLNGFVLGEALEPYQSDDEEAVGTVFISLNIHPVASFVGSRSNIIGSLRQALSVPVLSPVATFRYLLAFLIALIAFALGFFYFGRVVKSGVDAIGRNPLARREIQTMVFINIAITLTIVIVGLGIALLILIL